MKIIHAADLHIDSPLRGLSRYPEAPVEQIREATRRAFENLIELCIEERASILLLAGDLFDGDWKDYSTGLLFVAQLTRLREVGTVVYLVRGNHDASSQLARRISLPDHCHEFATKRPESVVNEALGVALHGQGYATRAVTTDLAESYPDGIPGLLNVGLLHTSMGGREGHENYAPTRVDVLASKGYDYWALGHVHEREVVSRDPWVVFPGNLQGRHVREVGAKGATLIEVADGRIVDVSHRTLDVVRWARCAVDASEASTADDIIDLTAQRLNESAEAADGRLLAARVVVSGASRAHARLHADPEAWDHEVRAHAIASGVGDIWVERISFETRPHTDLQMLAERDDALAQVLQGFAAAQRDDELVRELGRELEDVNQALPRELRAGPGGLDLGDLATLRALLAEVEQSILPRILAEDTD